MERNGGDSPRRIAVVAADPEVRRGLLAVVGEVAGVDVVAWADGVEPLLVLGSRVDACLCTDPPGREATARLTERGTAVVVVDPGADPPAVRSALDQLRARGPDVRADPRPPVTQPPDEFRRQPQRIIEVRQNDEVVLGAMALGKPHTPIVATLSSASR